MNRTTTTFLAIILTASAAWAGDSTAVAEAQQAIVSDLSVRRNLLASIEDHVNNALARANGKLAGLADDALLDPNASMQNPERPQTDSITEAQRELSLAEGDLERLTAVWNHALTIARQVARAIPSTQHTAKSLEAQFNRDLDRARARIEHGQTMVELIAARNAARRAAKLAAQRPAR